MVYSIVLDFTSEVVHYLPPTPKGSKMPLLDNIRASARHHYADRCTAKMLGTQTVDNANCIGLPEDHLQPCNYKWACLIRTLQWGYTEHYPVSACHKSYLYIGLSMQSLRFTNAPGMKRTDITHKGWRFLSLLKLFFLISCAQVWRVYVWELVCRCVVLLFLAVIGLVQRMPSNGSCKNKWTDHKSRLGSKARAAITSPI